MFLFKYTCYCKDSEGVDHSFEHRAFFDDGPRKSSLDLLNHWLLKWSGVECPNGGIYRYGVTSQQELENMIVTPIVPENAPALIGCWTGRQGHQHFVTGI